MNAYKKVINAELDDLQKIISELRKKLDGDRKEDIIRFTIKLEGQARYIGLLVNEVYK